MRPQGRGGAGHPGALAGRVRRAAALVFCASLVAPLLGAGGSAEAQDVLVSNLSSGTTTFVRLGAGTDSKDAVQLFTTGTNTTGYTLASIAFEFYQTAHSSLVPTVKIHNVTVNGASVTLGTAVATLTTTATYVSRSAVETYTAPMDTTLARSTTYGVFVEGGSRTSLWGGKDTGDEDDTPAVGWSIGDQFSTRAQPVSD